jgi:DNA-binding FrmR family transcriptional regulator
MSVHFFGKNDELTPDFLGKNDELTPDFLPLETTDYTQLRRIRYGVSGSRKGAVNAHRDCGIQLFRRKIKMAEKDDLDSLRRRLARLEALVAALVASDARLDYPETAFLVERLLESHDIPDPELHLLLREFLSRRERGPSIEVPEKRLRAIEGEFRNLDRMLSSVRESLGDERIVDQIRSLRDAIDKLSTQHMQLGQDTHAVFAAQTLGLDLSEVPLRRFLPVRVYLSDDSPSIVNSVTDALTNLLDLWGFEYCDDFPVIQGSFWKKWFVKSKETLSQPEVQARLEKLERALEMKGLIGPQADVDKKEAETVETLARAAEKGDSAAFQLGSVLFIKHLTPDGKISLQARTLTQSQLLQLERDPELMNSPAEALRALSDRSSLARDEAAPPKRKRRITRPND